MSCQQTHELIHGYVDGELDLVNSIEVEKHLEDCLPCTQKYDSVRTLKKSLANPALRFDPPADLEKRLRTALRREDGTVTRSSVRRWRPGEPEWGRWRRSPHERTAWE